MKEKKKETLVTKLNNKQEISYETKSSKEVVKELCSDEVNGLSNQEAEDRLAKDGLNALAEAKKDNLFITFIKQFNDPMIYILIAAAIISLVVAIIEHSEEWIDSIIIFAVILLNATIGTVQEAKASKALEALKKMSSPRASVRRNGEIVSIDSTKLVVGDIVIVEEGNVIPADLRMIKTVNFKADESSLTGESVPVEKNADIVFNKEVGIGDRVNMAFSSSICSYGRGEGVVVATGMNTQIGRIASLLNSEEDNQTPLQKKLGELSKLLGITAVCIVILMLIVSLFKIDYSLGEYWDEIIQSFLLAISLAVAAVPEGLTAVVTIVLSLGVQRMAKAHTIVKKLPSVETLGAVDVVCSDKTGTLTQNKMTVVQAYVNSKLNKVENFEKGELDFLANGMTLCSNASIETGEYGDPTEIALVKLAQDLGNKKSALEAKYPRVDEYPFDSVRKMMSTQHTFEGKSIIFTKGALDSILKHTVSILDNGKVRKITQKDIDMIHEASSKMSSEALRNLALAYKEDDSLTEDNLIFVGLVGMIDPARKEAKPAVNLFRSASIRTIMITGDHVDTAYAIAKDLTIAENRNQCMSGAEIDQLSFDELREVVKTTNVFARVSPDNKVSIVKALKANNEIVAMTGDGVNDAPSLKAADIGIAMGITGTDVAKGAADMVLTDDNFASIEKAVEEGRNIYNNVKKTIIFLLSSNLAEVLVIFLATACFSLPSPLVSIHLLWVNLITDSLPALALGTDKKDKDIMKDKPRKADESLFAHGAIWQIVVYAIIFTIVTLGAFLAFPVVKGGCSPFDFKAINAYFDAHHDALVESQSLAFTMLAITELFHMFGMTDMRRSIIHVFKDKNFMLWGAFALGVLLQVAVTEIPGIAGENGFFKTRELTFVEWGYLILFGLAPIYVHELIIFVNFLIKKFKPATGK